MDYKSGRTKATILGSGTCCPSLERSSCSVLIEIDSDKLLLDIGLGTIHRLLCINTNIYDISYILISHLHPDHTSELIPFLFSSKYAYNFSRNLILTIIAWKGFINYFEQLKNIYGHWIDLGDQLRIIELSVKSRDFVKFQNFEVESIPVNHNDESIAYRININDSLSIVYSGDTDYSENLIDLSKNADILICEASKPDENKIMGHLTPSLAGKIAKYANVKKLVLTHLYPECDTIDIESQCRKTYDGPILIAKDLLNIL